MTFFVRRSGLSFEGCSEDLCIFFFFIYFLYTLLLHCDSKPCNNY